MIMRNIVQKKLPKRTNYLAVVDFEDFRVRVSNRRDVLLIVCDGEGVDLTLGIPLKPQQFPCVKILG